MQYSRDMIKYPDSGLEPPMHLVVNIQNSHELRREESSSASDPPRSGRPGRPRRSNQAQWYSFSPTYPDEQVGRWVGGWVQVCSGQVGLRWVTRGRVVALLAPHLQHRPRKRLLAAAVSPVPSLATLRNRPGPATTAAPAPTSTLDQLAATTTSQPTTFCQTNQPGEQKKTRNKTLGEQVFACISLH